MNNPRLKEFISTNFAVPEEFRSKHKQPKLWQIVWYDYIHARIAKPVVEVLPFKMDGNPKLWVVSYGHYKFVTTLMGMRFIGNLLYYGMLSRNINKNCMIDDDNVGKIYVPRWAVEDVLHEFSKVLDANREEVNFLASSAAAFLDEMKSEVPKNEAAEQKPALH